MKPSLIHNYFHKIFICVLSAVIGLTFHSFHSFGHPLNNGYSQIVIDRNEVRFELFIPEPSLLIFDTNGDKQLTESELSGQQIQLENYFKEHLQLQNRTETMDLKLLQFELTEKETIPGITFQMRFSSNEEVQSLTVSYSLLFDDSDPEHINFAMIMNGEDVDQTVWNSEHRTYRYEPLTKPGLLSALWLYFTLGIGHILAGFDHLLFLVSLILVASKMKEAVAIVTSFTVAHSITLFLAATGTISVNSNAVEASIALTIAYVAVENFFVKEAGRRWILTFLFGLIHGMGLAGALKEAGWPQDDLISSLLSFNAGIEFGQLAIVAVLLPVIFLLRKLDWYRKLVYAGSGLILLISLIWFAERAGWL